MRLLYVYIYMCVLVLPLVRIGRGCEWIAGEHPARWQSCSGGCSSAYTVYPNIYGRDWKYCLALRSLALYKPCGEFLLSRSDGYVVLSYGGPANLPRMTTVMWGVRDRQQYTPNNENNHRFDLDPHITLHMWAPKLKRAIEGLARAL